MDPIKALNKDLFEKVRVGDTQSVTALLTERADVNSQLDEDTERLTPIHVACIRGHLDIVKVLMQAKANIEAREHVWFTFLPLDIMLCLFSCLIS